MLEFIGKNNFGKSGDRKLEYDVNITKISAGSRKGKQYYSVRIGLRNDCKDRINDDYVAVAFDKEIKTLYLVPARTLSEENKSMVKLYKISPGNSTSGYAVCSSLETLLNFVEEANLWGYNNMEMDATTGWYTIKPR